MSEKDNLKDFIKNNISDTHTKPVNEWTEILKKIDEESSFFLKLKNTFSLKKASLCVLTVFVAVVSFNSLNTKHGVEDTIASTEDFYIDYHNDNEDNTEDDDYTYLALLEENNG